MKKNKLLILSLLTIFLASCGGGQTSSLDNSSSSSEKISNNVSSSEHYSSENTSSEYYSSEELSSATSSTSQDIENSSFDSITSENDVEAEKLSTPTLLIDDSTGVVSWNSINGATHYNYIINDGEIKSTTSLTISLENESNISVQAASNDSVSEWSNAVTYFDTSDIIIKEEKEVYVYFHNSNIKPITIMSGNKITRPSDPNKDNATFDNWYADPFHEEVFDFNTIVTKNTILYANYIEDDLIKDTYFWIKANQKITSAISGNTSSSGWKFIPLKLNDGSSIKEYYATVEVKGASISDPAAFLIMDGFKDNEGRTYWKNNDSDFFITSDGIYNIYFSLETQYKLDGNIVHAHYEAVDNTYLKYANNNTYSNKLETPLVSVDLENNKAMWQEIENANGYEVIINNSNPTLIENNYITLNKGEHISCRAKGVDSYSSWSIPKANRNYVYEGEEEVTYAFVYFYESDISALKVNINETINEPTKPTKDGYSFEGWYKDIALKEKAIFPYTVLKNTIFYPKWTCEDYANKEYYKLVDENNNKISSLTWNLDNYDFLEYETEEVELKTSSSYYIKTLDENKTYGPYKVDKDGIYKIYFSEDNIWNINTTNASNAYFSYIPQGEITIYFSNNQRWSGTINAYVWNDSSGKYEKSWPGNAMTYAKTNSYGEDIYSYQVDLSLYDHVIFNNGSSQTCNIPLANAYNGIGYYVSGSSYGTYEFN